MKKNEINILLEAYQLIIVEEYLLKNDFDNDMWNQFVQEQ